jgi:hypothetical protein
MVELDEKAVDGSIDIRLDDKGGIDEIFGNGVLCHIERLGNGHWFIILTRPDQTQEAFWLSGKGKVEFTMHEHRTAPTVGPNVSPWTIATALSTARSEGAREATERAASVPGPDVGAEFVVVRRSSLELVLENVGWDSGPFDEGWSSNELLAAKGELEAAAAIRAQGETG